MEYIDTTAISNTHTVYPIGPHVWLQICHSSNVLYIRRPLSSTHTYNVVDTCTRGENTAGLQDYHYPPQFQFWHTDPLIIPKLVVSNIEAMENDIYSITQCVYCRISSTHVCRPGVNCDCLYFRITGIVLLMCLCLPQGIYLAYPIVFTCSVIYIDVYNTQ